jgi:hypothetical protein
MDGVFVRMDTLTLLSTSEMLLLQESIFKRSAPPFMPEFCSYLINYLSRNWMWGLTASTFLPGSVEKPLLGKI